MQLTSHNYQNNFCGLSRDSKKFILDEMREMKHDGHTSNLHSIMYGMKALDKKAGTYYKVFYNGDVIFMQPMRGGLKQIELVQGFFFSIPLEKFLAKATSIIEREIEKLNTPPKVSLWKKFIKNIR